MSGISPLRQVVAGPRAREGLATDRVECLVRHVAPRLLFRLDGGPAPHPGRSDAVPLLDQTRHDLGDGAVLAGIGMNEALVAAQIDRRAGTAPQQHEDAARVLDLVQESDDRVASGTRHDVAGVDLRHGSISIDVSDPQPRHPEEALVTAAVRGQVLHDLDLGELHGTYVSPIPYGPPRAASPCAATR
jgi:hypothetical protein